MTFKRDSEFTDLTKAQVEALLECFDFLHNGYQDMGTYNFDSVALFRLRHKRKGTWIKVVSRTDSYDIYKDKELRKSVVFKDDFSRYRLMVNSDMSVGVVRLSVSADARFVSG
jgi:hypothetical protein